MKRFPVAALPRALALACLNTYLVIAALSVVIAHVLLIAKPGSGWGERLMSPVANGLVFIDAHWRSFLVLAVAPFVAPLARDLIPRIRKVGTVEFDPVPLEPIAVGEKPTREPSGGSE